MDVPRMEGTVMNSSHQLPMNRLNFVFRLDAGGQFGNGHFMRCMVLCVELLERGHAVTLLAQSMPLPLKSLIRERGLVLQDINPASDGLAELAYIHNEASVDWLVIDHYGIDAGWESAARPFAAQIMVIDDLANRRHDCDVLVDQNVPNRLQQLYTDLLPQQCVQVMGWSNLLARSEFYAKGDDDRSGTLLFLGGGDHSEPLTALIEKLLELVDCHPLKVLVSSDYLPMAHWQERLSSGGQVYCDLRNPAPLYRSAKLAVVRCGFVSYELALLGIPAVNIHSTPVQAEVANALQRMGTGVALSEDDLSDSECLQKALHQAAAMAPKPLNETLRPGAKQVANLLEKFHEHR